MSHREQGGLICPGNRKVVEYIGCKRGHILRVGDIAFVENKMSAHIRIIMMVASRRVARSRFRIMMERVRASHMQHSTYADIPLLGMVVELSHGQQRYAQGHKHRHHAALPRQLRGEYVNTFFSHKRKFTI